MTRISAGAGAAEMLLSRGQRPVVKTEADILPMALEAAARSGDANLELVQQVTVLGSSSGPDTSA